MGLNEINFLIFNIFIIFLTLIINYLNFLNVLLLVEFIWISLYGIATLGGYIFDDLAVLSFSFFFLIFSTAELTLGFILLILQTNNLSISNLTELNFNSTNILTKFTKHIYINKIK